VGAAVVVVGGVCVVTLTTVSGVVLAGFGVVVVVMRTFCSVVGFAGLSVVTTTGGGDGGSVSSGFLGSSILGALVVVVVVVPGKVPDMLDSSPSSTNDTDESGLGFSVVVSLGGATGVCTFGASVFVALVAWMSGQGDLKVFSGIRSAHSLV